MLLLSLFGSFCNSGYLFLKWEYYSNPVPVMRSQRKNPNSGPCENQVLSRLSTQSRNFCLLYNNFLQRGNERAVTDLTGTEKDQVGEPDKKYSVSKTTNENLRKLVGFNCWLAMPKFHFIWFIDLKSCSVQQGTKSTNRSIAGKWPVLKTGAQPGKI